MGSVIQLVRRRHVAAFDATAKPRSRGDDSHGALLVLVGVFTATAIAMSGAVVLAGSSSWAEAAPLIAFVVVFALTKVALANAVFYVMIRSDSHSEAAAAAALKAKSAGTVIRRKRTPPGSRQLNSPGMRPRKAGTIRLALAPRRQPNAAPPHRTNP